MRGLRGDGPCLGRRFRAQPMVYREHVMGIGADPRG